MLKPTHYHTNIQIPTHSSTYNSVRHILQTPSHYHTNIQLPTHSSTYNSVRHFLLNPTHSHTKCPTAHTLQYIQFSTPLPADPLTLPHKMSNYQHTALHFNSVRHSLLTPSNSHTKCPTTNTQQYIQFSTPLPADPLHTPTQNVQLPTHSSTYNSVRHFLLNPSHSHTKCPTTNT